MRTFLLLFIIVFACTQASAQYTLINHFSGSMAYGSRIIAVMPSATGAATYPDPCIGPPSPHFWCGASYTAGMYTFTSSAPVYAIKLEMEGLNGGPLGGGEYMEVYINGAPYSLTPADVVSFSSCGSPGAPPCYIYGGKFYGPITSSLSGTEHNAGKLDIRQCHGFTSFAIYCNGIGNGVAYHISFDSTAPPTTCLNASNNGSLCAGDTLKLFATNGTAGVPYQWFGPLGFTSTLQNPVIPNATVANSGTYFVVQTVGGVNDTAYTTVVVNPPPVVTASGSTPVCEGDSIALAVGPYTAGLTFSWAGPSSFSSVLQNPKRYASLSASGVYTVITSMGSCKDTDLVNIVVKPKPSVSATCTSPVCVGSTIGLFASPHTAGETFSWSGPAGYASTLQNPTITGATLANAGTYTVTTNLNGCQDTATVNVTISSPADITASGNSPLCEGDNIVLNATSSIAGSSFHWTGPSSFTATIPNPVINNATAANSGVYTVIGGLAGCIDTSTVSIVVKPKPQLSATADSVVCEGQQLHLTASSTSPGIAFSWFGPNFFSSTDQNPIITSVSSWNTGNYIVRVTENGCTASVTVRVKVVDLGEGHSADTTVCSDKPIAISLNSGAPVTSNVTWSSGAYGTQLEVTKPGVYWFLVSSNGCIRADTINVNGEKCLCGAVLPTAFSPNGDDLNDFYSPIIIPGCTITDYYFAIYNRWGQMVFSATHPKSKWDGLFLDVQAELGVYMYYLSYSAGAEKTRYTMKGDVTLVR